MAEKKAAQEVIVPPESVAVEETVTAYKGFDKDWKCRGMQYEVGKTYKHDGEVEICKSGFHACEYPMDVLAYYSPEASRFAKVILRGTVERHDEDSKIASASLSVDAELSIPQLVCYAIAWVTKLCKPANASHATGDRSASSATGDRSASSATGDRSASSATGYSSASSATGDSSASSATGYSSASSATGDSSASSATGDSSASLNTGYCGSSRIDAGDGGHALHAVALATGEKGRAKAPFGSAIVLVYRDDDGRLVHIRASKVGENGVKPDTWYSLNASGEFIEVK